MPFGGKKSVPCTGILNALLPGARVDKNTKKILVHVSTSDETIVFNIGGTIFETYRSTLRSIPNSLLANDAFIAKYHRQDKHDYFFDRDPEVFHCILNYLRTGELHLPTTVCGPVVQTELEFWGIDEVEIAECCWSRYSNWAETLGALRRLEQDRLEIVQNSEFPQDDNQSWSNRVRRRMWRFFTDQNSSRAAMIYGYVFLCIIFASIFSFCAQTHEAFQVTVEDKVRNETTASAIRLPLALGHVNSTTTLSSSPSQDYDISDEPVYKFFTVLHDAPHLVLYYLDIACLIIFALELLVRFLVAPNKARFVQQLMYIIEFLALLPDLADVMANMLCSSYSEYKRIHDFLNFFKLLRIFRVFRLMRHIPGLWILLYTLKASAKDLLLLLVFLGIGMLVFASLVFFAEYGVQEEFSSIPKCFWWAVITMTTVGYGDMYPVTNWGYLIGTATGISGVLMVGFTVPILVNNFVMYYQHLQATLNRERHRDARTSLSNRNNSAGGGGLDSGGLGGLGGLSSLMGFRKLSDKTKDEEDMDSNANQKGVINNGKGKLPARGDGSVSSGGEYNMDYKERSASTESDELDEDNKDMTLL